MQARFEGRVVFITGAGSGAGRATAELFATEGAKVFAVDVNAVSVQETIAGIRQTGGTADGGACDVADMESVQRSIGRAVEAFGGLQILINVAGVGRAVRLEE